MTTVTGQLLLMLETVANALGDDLRKRLVFVGGCTTALFITDEVVLESVRATDDVDLIVDLVGRAQWAQRVAASPRSGISAEKSGLLYAVNAISSPT